MSAIKTTMFPEFEHFVVNNLEIVTEILTVARSFSETPEHIIEVYEILEQSLLMNNMFLAQMKKHPVATKMLFRN